MKINIVIEISGSGSSNKALERISELIEDGLTEDGFDATLTVRGRAIDRYGATDGCDCDACEELRRQAVACEILYAGQDGFRENSIWN